MSTVRKLKVETGNLKKMDIDFEQKVAEQLQVMSAHKNQSISEIVNKAVKKFISQHKDYFPNGEKIVADE